MIQSNKSKLRILPLLIAVALIFASMPSSALAASGFSAIVKSDTMRVFRDPYFNNYWGSLNEGTVVTVKAYRGSVAQIRYAGRTGYAAVSDMSTVESVAKVGVLNSNTRIFKSASTRSASIGVRKGLVVNVLGIKGTCAKVERNGYVGYVYSGHLTLEGDNTVPPDAETPTEPETPVQPETPVAPEKPSTPTTIEEIINSGKYSNEELCYAFAVKMMGYNPAAAAGLISNIRSESSFKPEISGDSGTSIGICQWHLGRKTRLITWCNNNDYDYKSLLGQLYYLKYELETYYPSVNKYMKSVDNSAQGAYDAGYYFCYNFEAPANRGSKSVQRGNYAKETYYPKYAA